MRQSSSRYRPSSFFGCCVVRMTRNLDLLEERNGGTMLTNPAENLSRGYEREESWNTQALVLLLSFSSSPSVIPFPRFSGGVVLPSDNHETNHL
jgi:hypothetical protein